MGLISNNIQAAIDKGKKILEQLNYIKYNRLGRKFARKTKRVILKTARNFGQEAGETQVMVQSFFRLLESKLDMNKRKTPPSPEEIRAAIEQLVDVGRFSFFASISLLPGGGFTLIGLEMLARKFGLKQFTLLPSSFRAKNRYIKFRSRGKMRNTAVNSGKILEKV